MSATPTRPGAAWVAAQQPPPPDALAARVREALGAAGRPSGDDPADRATACLGAAEALLGRLVAAGATGTRSREAALDLLAADALVTYAFEAASDAPATLPALARDAILCLARVGGAAGAR
jgi:hypothetical protein